MKSVQGAHTISIVYEKETRNVEDHTACLCRSGTFVSGLCLLLKSPADTADPQAQTGSGKTPQSADQMAQRRVEYRRNFIEFSETVHKKRTVSFFASCYNKAERMGNVWTHL